MRIVVLGATGGTGMELIKQSLASGHSVTAFARNPGSLGVFDGAIRIESGNLLDREELAKVLGGHDAVLSGFGPRVPISKADAHLLRDFGSALTLGMQRSGVRRLVLISTAFLFKDSMVPPTYLIGKLFFPSVVTDAADLESIVEQSNLDWTIVRPPQLTDLPLTRHYRERIGHLPRFGFKISRADAADYFLRIVQDQTLIRKVIGISN
jgi:putative NADH-flavin reductase